MGTSEKDNRDKHKRKVHQEPEYDRQSQTSDETSSLDNHHRSVFSKKPARHNRPLGSSHEPGVMPGS